MQHQELYTTKYIQRKFGYSTYKVWQTIKELRLETKRSSVRRMHLLNHEQLWRVLEHLNPSIKDRVSIMDLKKAHAAYLHGAETNLNNKQIKMHGFDYKAGILLFIGFMICLIVLISAVRMLLLVQSS